MNHYYAEIPEKPIDLEKERKRTVEVLLKEEEEIDRPKTADYKTMKRIPFRIGDTTLTCENKYHYHFSVPSEVYSIEKYREKLNDAETLDEVEHILNDYCEHHRKH